MRSVMPQQGYPIPGLKHVDAATIKNIVVTATTSTPPSNHTPCLTFCDSPGDAAASAGEKAGVNALGVNALGENGV